MDGGCTLKFPVRIETLPSGLKSITISMPTLTVLPAIPQPYGLSTGGLCTPRFRVGGGEDIQGDVHCNKFVGTRALLPVVAAYEEEDTVHLECGEGSGGCFGASPVITFSCKLNYTWELVSAPNGVSIIPQTLDRNTALLVIGSEVGMIHLRVKIKDALVAIGGGVVDDGQDDTDVQVDEYIRIMDLGFIDQQNTAIPREIADAMASTLDSACLRVSSRVTTAKINSLEASSQWPADWDGPTTDSPDPCTYRLHIDSTYPSAPDLAGPVEIKIKRIAFPGNSGAIPAYFDAFVCKNQVGGVTGPAPFRSYEHFRLVSNYDAGDATAGHVFDDSLVVPMADRQTIAVGLRDAIRASLYVGGAYAAEVALPVNSPPIGQTNSIRSVKLRWTELKLGGQSTGLDLASSERRISEELAQIGVRVASGGSTPAVVASPVLHNAIYVFVSVQPQGGLVTLNTVVRIDGNDYSVSGSTTSGDAFQAARDVGLGVVSSLSAHFPSIRHGLSTVMVLVNQNPVQQSPMVLYAIVPRPGQETLLTLPTPQAPPAALLLNDATLEVANFEYTPMTAVMWALNYKDGGELLDEQSAGAETIDLLVTPTAYRHRHNWRLSITNIWGWSYVWSPGGVQSAPALAGTVFIRGGAVDPFENDPLGTGWAGGHEIIHQLAKSTDHRSIQTHLMLGSYPAVAESAQSPKRLPYQDNTFSVLPIQAVSAGSAIPQLLFSICH